jgi:hypothetical protein
MRTVNAAVAALHASLDQHFLIFSSGQDLHFDWFGSVAFQLRM